MQTSKCFGSPDSSIGRIFPVVCWWTRCIRQKQTIQESSSLTLYSLLCIADEHSLAACCSSPVIAGNIGHCCGTHVHDDCIGKGVAMARERIRIELGDTANWKPFQLWYEDDMIDARSCIQGSKARRWNRLFPGTIRVDPTRATFT